MNNKLFCRIMYSLTGHWEGNQHELTQPIRLTRSAVIIIYNFIAALILIALVYSFFWVSCFAMESCYQAQFVEFN